MLVAEVDDLHHISHTVAPKPAALTAIAPTPTVTLGHVVSLRFSSSLEAPCKDCLPQLDCFVDRMSCFTSE